MTAFSFAGAALVAASSSAVTPLYRLYQQSMHLSPLMITLVFAVYAISLLAALLTVGGLSDYVGRRPVILGGLLLNAIAMVLFSYASDVGQLILARAVQGLCVGTATTALGAAILDTDRKRGPLLNSVTAFLGLMVGALGAAALVTFAPDPLHLVYEVLFALTVVMIVLLFVMPETVSRKSGALASLRPHVRVPSQSRAALLRVAPATVATWALGGFSLSLMPTVVATTMGVSAPWVGGVVVATLMLAAALTVAALRQLPAQRLLVIGTAALSLGVFVSLLGIWQHSVAMLFAGSVIAGFGFGASFAGSLSTLLPTAEAHQRAGLLAAFYVLSYLAFSLPALAAGVAVPYAGLAVVAYVYGAVVILLAIMSMIASLRGER
ncbi:Predicted arabinose efflux permease, MFS family [Tardiphaga sp. OK246]|jgi:MFS family permease|uniref:MFS transporter n=1 Tax=Tardiphaga sp. OK246 TaxID=1855307 RepID=UPI000B6ED7A4|nr:MFS transporter [Tardiphaga sp. OK246]SNT61219.1 Predicted arabinose efflux permease, MFS family [Tardiphaga sp. OK246]